MVGSLDRKQIEVKELIEGTEKWLYCESPAKEAVATSMKTFFQKRLEDDLNKVELSLQKPKGRKKYYKVIERIGRIKEKHKRIASCYEINVIPSSDGLMATKIEWKQIEEKIENKLNGRYYLRTNLVHLCAKELWNIYNGIRVVEEAFRFMKSSLGLRPVYHQLEKRVDGHLWITILAYSLIQDIIYRLRSNGITHSWETIRSQFSNRIRISMYANTNTNQTVHIRSTTEEEQFHLQIYKALKLSSKIIGTRKTIL
jgi:hypothetical protein